MFQKILIANRGEIALRIIRTCKEMGIRTVAVHSTADADSLHVRFADQAICIGPAPSKESYLNIPRLMSAADVTQADAIHPGYGFLAENVEFAEVCNKSGVVFIGPSPENMRTMGNKIAAREAAKKAGLPLVPGSEKLNDEKAGRGFAKEVGYPVIIKAAAGGGGKGMKIVRADAGFANSFLTARAEATASFGNGDLYVEKYIENPRHVEFQVVADHHGEVVVLGERDCSIQRRHQKLVEESPCPVMGEKMRARMSGIIIVALKKLKYRNVGTIEFLMDQKGSLYFIEMNTRIQVEHPVTEFVTGLDLVKAQIQIAAGEKLSPEVRHATLTGHSIECRITAEDPETFRPSPGRISGYHAPGGIGVRVDSAVCDGYLVTPNYDSMLAKLIVYGKDRPEAIRRMQRALDEFVVEGIKTSIPLQRRILAHNKFIKGEVDTGFLEKNL
jgi:acetyl-CoA carboxylase biotin carboxylase subunit